MFTQTAKPIPATLLFNPTTGEHPLIYAHIFKARASTGKKFVLVLSEGFQPTGHESYYDSKAEAKAAAAAAGAKAWNY